MENKNYFFQLKEIENNIKNVKIDFDESNNSLNNAKNEFNKSYIQLRNMYEIISPSFRAHNKEVVLSAFEKYNKELEIFNHCRNVLTKAEASFQCVSEKLDKENNDYKKIFHNFQSEFDKIQI